MPAAVRTVSTYNRDLFEKLLAEKCDELSALGYDLEVHYRPVFNNFDIIYTALILGWEVD